VLALTGTDKIPQKNAKTSCSGLVLSTFVNKGPIRPRRQSLQG
jgi:hypothetical protein